MGDGPVKSSRRGGSTKHLRDRSVPYILAELDRGTGYNKLARLLCKREGVGERTAKKWIKFARETRKRAALPRITATIASEAIRPPSAPQPTVEAPTVDESNYGKARWKQLEFFHARADTYQVLADELRTDNKRPYEAEKLVIKYHEMIGRLVHWYQLPPERMMTQPAIRAAALKAILEGVKHMEHGELHTLLQGVAAEHEARIAAAARDENPVETEAEKQYQEAVGDVV